MAEVTILIPCYNVERFLPSTIQSVLDQTFEDWELIILEDCSEDNTYAVAQAWQQRDPRIKLYRNECNLGMLENWNKGIGLCHSEYFVKLDADDIWDPTMLEKSLAVLKAQPEVGLVFSRYINIDPNGKLIDGSDVPLPEFASNKSFSCVDLVKQGPDKMLSYPVLRQGLSIMRRAIFDSIGPYRFLLTRKTQASTDTEFYFRLGAHYKIYCIDEVLYNYRIHGTSISALDESKFLVDTKIYEIKICIINYYTDHGILSEGERKKFLKTVNAQYAYSEIAYFKNTRQWSVFFKKLLVKFIGSPFSFSKFYFTRLLKKLTPAL